MYQIRNKVYSEAGYILIGNRKKGYQFNGQLSDFTEEKITLDDMEVKGDYVSYSGILQYIGVNPDYGMLKRDMVKRRYSYDDQIAIILNNDPESMQKMQEWRDWSSLVATKIMSLLEVNESESTSNEQHEHE